MAQALVNIAHNTTCCAVHAVGALELAAKITRELMVRRLPAEEIEPFETAFARLSKEIAELQLEHHTIGAPSSKAAH